MMDYTQLLKETKEFLEGLREEGLSAKTETIRQRLLSKLAVSHSPPPAYYIDMTKSTIIRTQEKQWADSGYETMGPPPLYSNTMPDVLSTSKRLSALSLSASEEKVIDAVAVRCGPLRRRRRRRWLPARVTHHWAALAGSVLRLYRGPSSGRPPLVLDLAKYRARPALTTPTAFELFCPGRKTLQLEAESMEEMEAWVEAFRSATGEGRQLPEPPEPQDHYDVPDSRLRPVVAHHYAHLAPHPAQKYLLQEHVYKNVDDWERAEGEGAYYNVVRKVEQHREEIYQTIGESSPTAETKKTGRVQQIVKAMESQESIVDPAKTTR